MVTVVAVVTVAVRGGDVTVLLVVVVLVGCTMVVVLPMLTEFVVGVDELLLASRTMTTTTAATASAIPPAIAQPRPAPPRSGWSRPFSGPSPGAAGGSPDGGSKLSDMTPASYRNGKDASSRSDDGVAGTVLYTGHV